MDEAPYGDIVSPNARKPTRWRAAGCPIAKLGGVQQKQLLALIEVYGRAR